MHHLALCITLAAFVLGCRGARESVSNASAPYEEGDGAPLHVETYSSSRISSHPRLIVVLHGDAPFNDPDYHYTLARLVAVENEDVVAVGLLRPGYADPQGHRSPGNRGQATGDNYSPEAIHAVAETIEGLRDVYEPGQVLVVGHSGGAAVAANLLGLAPGLVEAAVLVSCPCDVPRFREHMGRLRDDASWQALWQAPVRSLSPTDLVPDMDPATRVVLLVGTEDDVTPPGLTEAYAERLKARRVDVEVVMLEGAGHEVFLDERVRAAISHLLDDE